MGFISHPTIVISWTLSEIPVHVCFIDSSNPKTKHPIRTKITEILTKLESDGFLWFHPIVFIPITLLFSQPWALRISGPQRSRRPGLEPLGLPRAVADLRWRPGKLRQGLQGWENRRGFPGERRITWDPWDHHIRNDPVFSHFSEMGKKNHMKTWWILQNGAPKKQTVIWSQNGLVSYYPTKLRTSPKHG